MRIAFTSKSVRTALSLPLFAGIAANKKLLTAIRSLLLPGKPQRDRYLVAYTGGIA